MDGRLANGITPDTRVDVLAERLITQINYRFVYKDINHPMHGIGAVQDSLDALIHLPPHSANTLLRVSNRYTSRFTCNEAIGYEHDDHYIDPGWIYTQLLAATDDEIVIEKYLLLLRQISEDPTSSKEVLSLLHAADDKGFVFGRRGSLKNKLAYLNLLCFLKSDECPYQANLNEIQALLEIPDKKGMTFLHDIAFGLSAKSKKAEREQYCGLVYFMVNNDLLSGSGNLLLAKNEDVIARHIQRSLTDEEKKSAFKNASSSDHPLGLFFRFKHDSKETKILKNFRIESQELQPFESDLSEYEVRSCPESPTPEKHRKKTWADFFSPRKRKEEYIPLQTFSNASAKLNGPSKLD